MLSVWPAVVPQESRRQGPVGLDKPAGWRDRSGLEWSVHPPTPYIDRHWPHLLPDWLEPVGSVILLLQKAPQPLMALSASAEASKVQLRDRALVLGNRVQTALQNQGYRAALFDPKTGLPAAGIPGKSLDDVAVVQALLGYRAVREGTCACICHPSWGFAVYPTTLLCAAAPSQVAAIEPELWHTTTAARRAKA
ncbi:MAG: methylmalonic aciduria and homocystinuria type D protein [Elainellaceae cyanobacterium]